MSKIIKLSDAELRQLQLIELEMLIEVDRVCRKNNIKYSLDGGTLLGAVRHGGFIPWDDDLDVMFTHEEYEKFYVACQKDLDTTRFFFQDFRNDPCYRWGYGKIRRLNTEYIKSGQEHLKQRTGICIDVFDYQYLPKSNIKKKTYRFKMFCIRKTMYSALGKYAEKKWIMRLWYSILCIIPISIVQRIRLKELNALNGICSDKMSCEMFPTPSKKEGVNSGIFSEYQDIEFEGMNFMAVKKADEYLSISYGDYMALPPLDKRKGVMNAVKYKFVPESYTELYHEHENMLRS